MAQSQAANLFGGKGFWSFAIIASIVFATTSYCSEQDKKAAAEKQYRTAKSLATEADAISTCKGWMKQVYGDGDPSFRVLKTSITRKGDLSYTMDVLMDQRSNATKSRFQSVEDCGVLWNYKKNAWEVTLKR